MSKIRKKLTACATAAVTLALSVGSLNASAITPTITPNFGLEYAVYTERVSENEVKLTFHVTKNPGINGLSVVFLCDDSCTPVASNVDTADLGGVIEHGSSAGSKAFYTCSYGDADFGRYTGKVNLSVTYKINGNISEKHDFNVGLTGISQFQKAGNEYLLEGNFYTEKSKEYNELIHETPISSGTNKNALVGDLNNDKTIDSFDVNCLQRITAYAEAGKYTAANPSQITLSELNNAICDYPTLWSDMPGLICADVANTDGNGVINKNDANELLSYIATIGASMTSKNVYIGKPITVSIVM